METADGERMVTDYAEAWDTRDPARIAALFAENALYEDIGPGTLYEGRPAIQAYVARLFEDTPDFTVTLLNAFASDQYVAMEWRISGTHQASGGHRFGVRGVSILELESGEIQRVTACWDRLTLLQQTGQAPPSR
jgi:steroid delta-isomerase-like uncharacterized protein